jgi:hypothetical protein
MDLIADRPPVCEYPSMTNEITRRDFMNGIAIADTSFADFEREIRRMLAPAGFDFERAVVELRAWR